MQTYEVTGSFVTIGIGSKIRLSNSQANIRSHLVKNKKKDIYEIISPVQFKKGEKISIESKYLGKSLLDNLKEIAKSSSNDDNKTKNDNVIYPCIQHVNFGKYNVFDKDKNLITDKPIKKDEAEKLLEEILQENEALDESQNDQDSDDDLEDSNINV